MINLLNIYKISLDYPEVNGAEQLEILMIRDQIAKLEPQLLDVLSHLPISDSSAVA